MLARILAAVFAAAFISTQSAKADHVFEIGFENKCWQTIDLAINYRNLDGDWEPKGWYAFQPGERKIIAQTTNRIFYYYAQSPGTTWSGEDREYRVRGDNIPQGFRERRVNRDDFGEWVTDLTCEDIEHFQIRVANYCNRELRFGIRYKDPDSDQWRTSPSYRLDPGERYSVLSTHNSIAYLHAGYGDKYFTGPDERDYRLNGRDRTFYRVDLNDTTNFSYRC